MPGIVRKLLIFAAVDGLVLQPLAHKGQRPAPATKIAYNEANIGPAPALKQRGENEDDGKSFEAFGIVGTSWTGNLGIYWSGWQGGRPR